MSFNPMAGIRRTCDTQYQEARCRDGSGVLSVEREPGFVNQAVNARMGAIWLTKCRPRARKYPMRLEVVSFATEPACSQVAREAAIRRY